MSNHSIPNGIPQTRYTKLSSLTLPGIPGISDQSIPRVFRGIPVVNQGIPAGIPGIPGLANLT